MNKDKKNYARNELGRDFVCGDLHGSFERLVDFMKFIHFDKEKDRMFSVGDLVDRGPDNEKCLRLLNEPWFHAVRGNHEMLMYDFLYGGPYAPYWRQNGGAWGCAYEKGVDDSMLGEEMRELAKRAADLPLMMTVEKQDGGKFHVIHAELKPGEKITDEDLENPEVFGYMTKAQNLDGEVVLWGRFIFYPLYRLVMSPENIATYKRTAAYHKMDAMFNDKLSHIYSGHTIMRQPTRFVGQTNLDTQAFASFGSLGNPWSRADTPEPWTGLTFTEPLTDKFWTAGYEGVKEVEVLDLS
jgi:serine/threonine protein phosphatase 1